MKVGVLGLQGDFREHLCVLERLGVEGVDVRTTEDLEGVKALIIPGGESTTLAHLMAQSGLDTAIQERARQGMPIYGTCAGMILLAKEITEGYPQSLGLMDICVERNAYGRQLDSFEADIEVKGLGAFHAVFIRAPKVVRCGPQVEVLAEHEGTAVLVRQGRLLAGSFHPELTDDVRLHELFLKMIS